VTPKDDDELVAGESGQLDRSMTGHPPDSDTVVMSLTPWLYQIAIFFSNSLLDEPALLALIFT
jgi:hypothetical protein